MTISIDVTEDSYILSGCIEKITDNPRCKSNFISNHATINDNENIVIPFSTNESNTEFPNQETQYKSILRILSKYGINHSLTGDTNDIVLKIEEENARFEKHSQLARNIRDGMCDKDKYDNFKSSLDKQLIEPLYPKQELAAFHLAHSQNACNFSVPGAGKTRIVYGAFSFLKNINPDDDRKIDKLLIISPSAAFTPWEDEFEKCFGRKAKSIRLAGRKSLDRQNILYSSKDYEMILTSYHSSSRQRDIDNLIYFLGKNKVMVVLDEAHKIKNLTGAWASAVLQIAPYAKSRIVLTGTPAPYGYQDLHNLYKFIWPKRSIITFPPNKLETISSAAEVNELEQQIAPFYIRIRKEDLNLPKPIIHDPILVEMDEVQQEIYSFLDDALYISLRDNSYGSITDAIRRGKVVRLRQAASNPSLLNLPLEKMMWEQDIIGDIQVNDRRLMNLITSCQPGDYIPPKFHKIKNMIEEINQEGAKVEDKKIIIWSMFTENIKQLHYYLDKNGIKSEVLFGEVPVERDDTEIDLITREKIIKKFHDTNSPFRVIIANPLVVGESVSLHKACHNAIYLEKDYNAAVYMQSKDRLHRVGLKTDDKINFYHLLSSGSLHAHSTVDEIIHNLVIQREEAMLGIVEGSLIPLLNMNPEDFGHRNTDYENLLMALDENRRTS